MGLLSILSIVLGLPAGAVDLDNLPEWVRVSVSAVHIDWAQVYPGLDLPPSVTIGTVSTAGPPTGVHGLVPPSSLGSVSLAASDSGVPVAQPARTDGSVLAATLVSLIDQGRLTEEGVSDYCAEHGIADDTIVRALDSLELSHPMKSPYLGLCAALWDRLGENVDACMELPYVPRIYMAAYLGVHEREDDAKTLLSSLVNPDRMALGADLYHVACEVSADRHRAYRLAIWCHKRGATLRGPADQAFVCFHIRQACEQLGDPVVVREELIPWAEAALVREPRTVHHGYALREMVWGYDYIGQSETGVDRAQAWLGPQGNEDTIEPALLYALREIARVQRRLGNAEGAAATLRWALHDASPHSRLANRAQADLLSLAADHPQIADAAVLPGLLLDAPDGVYVRGRIGEEVSQPVVLRGNSTFEVLSATSTLGAIRRSARSLDLDGGTATVTASLVIEAVPAVGRSEAIIILGTNDPEQPLVRVPLTIDGLAPVRIRPEALFFGVVRRGEERTIEALVESSIPLDILAVEVSDPGPLTVEFSREGPYALRVHATLSRLANLGRVEGVVRISTDLEAQPTLALPYYALVADGAEP